MIPHVSVFLFLKATHIRGGKGQSICSRATEDNMPASYQQRSKGRRNQGHDHDCYLLQRGRCRIVFPTIRGLLFCLLGVIPTATKAAGEVGSTFGRLPLLNNPPCVPWIVLRR